MDAFFVVIIILGPIAILMMFMTHVCYSVVLRGQATTLSEIKEIVAQQQQQQKDVLDLIRVIASETNDRRKREKREGNYERL